MKATDPVARHPRAEAEERLGGRYGARVLEPSPPTVDDEPWFADDPVSAPVRSPVVSPVANGNYLWAEIVATDPGLASWAADRALVASPLPSPPEGMVAAREALHQLAFYVIAPGRQAANGKIGLRYTKGGFGTPFFGDNRQLRIEGPNLVDQRAMDDLVVEPLTTIGSARRRTGIAEDLALHGPPRWDDGRSLEIEPEHIDFIARWFGTVTRVLETIRLEAAGLEPSRVQIWPEHFDAAVEIGPEERRAAFGGSPGDEAHPEPYVYVAPWSPPAPDPFWNDQSFGGASLQYADLVGLPNPDGTLLDFFRRGVVRLGPATA